MSAEEWREIPGLPGYEVSDCGSVRSLPRVATGKKAMRKPGCDLKLTTTHKGYLKVQLSQGGMRQPVFVHRLVMLAFVGPVPPGLEVRHLDGDPANNVLGNLAYGTHAENVRDSVRHGTHPEARKTACKYGHPFDSENTRIDSKGKRECRTCRRIKNRRINERRNAERAARGLQRNLRALKDEALVTAVRELYATTRLTQKEIAVRVGVGQSTVGRWVRGEIRPDLAGPITARGRGGAWRAAA